MKYFLVGNIYYFSEQSKAWYCKKKFRETFEICYLAKLNSAKISSLDIQGDPEKTSVFIHDLCYKKYISKQPDSIQCEKAIKSQLLIVMSFGISIHKTRKNHIR